VADVLAALAADERLAQRYLLGEAPR
jgi:hypothetical protein